MTAVLVNSAKHEALSALIEGAKSKITVYPVSFGPSLNEALQKIKCEVVEGRLNGVINFCCGDDCEEGLSAATVANFAERCGIDLLSCKTKVLGYPHDTLMMMIAYEGVLLPRYYVVSNSTELDSILPLLRVPCHLSPALSIVQGKPLCITAADSVEDTLRRELRCWGKIIVTEKAEGPAHFAELFVGYSGSVYTLDNSADGEFLSKCNINAGLFAKGVLQQGGFARLYFVANGSGEPVLETFELNPSFDRLGSLVCSLIHDLSESVVTKEAVFKIALHEDSRKGYRVCAAKPIEKGRIVFEDECRSFAIVTREHVRKYWSAEEKVTFSEYAWPLDSEGHLYCIWESDPTRWRPINHSCDPNCIFEKPHSLNVIAARDISPKRRLDDGLCDVLRRHDEAVHLPSVVPPTAAVPFNRTRA